MEKRTRACHGIAAALFAVFLTTAPLQARADGEGEIETSTKLEFQLTSRPEARFSIHQYFTFPFLQGQSPLTEDNNITLHLSAALTPVTLFGRGEVDWTPAAFFVLSVGGEIGSGWGIPIAHGTGINRPVGEVTFPGHVRDTEVDGEAFDGAICSAWGAGTIQFDLAALIPGDWNHFVFQTRQEMRYSAYTRAGKTDSWILENDHGENRNGWKYMATYILGYRIPQSPILSMLAIAAELDKSLYHLPGGEFWGDGLGYWFFSTLVILTISPRLEVTLALQMRSHRNNGHTNFDNNYGYYQDMELIHEYGERRFLFYRAAAIFNYKLR